MEIIEKLCNQASHSDGRAWIPALWTKGKKCFNTTKRCPVFETWKLPLSRNGVSFSDLSPNYQVSLVVANIVKQMLMNMELVKWPFIWVRIALWELCGSGCPLFCTINLHEVIWSPEAQLPPVCWGYMGIQVSTTMPDFGCRYISGKLQFKFTSHCIDRGHW